MRLGPSLLAADSPLLPSPFDVANVALASVALLLMVIAAMSYFRAAGRLSGTQALLWLLLIVVVPVVGPVIWLVVGRRRSRAS